MMQVESKDGSPSRNSYQIFEVFPGGVPTHRAFAAHLEDAWAILHELSKTTTNECFALHASTRQVVAQLNVPLAKKREGKLVFQIAYTEHMGIERSGVLRNRGYRVITVVGNKQAITVLGSTNETVHFFMLGHGAPHRDREAIVAWLRVKFPDVKILALNAPYQEIENADYNVLLNGPERWLPLVAAATA
jgi:hypothetical protein